MQGSLIIGIALFWAGYVSAISFMEAWLKFKASGVTLAIGLSIGKKIFKALNLVEWFLLFFFTVAWIFHLNTLLIFKILIPVLLLIILLLQTFYLLPALNKRADLVMNGQKVERSYIHIQYVMVEFVKVIVLVLLAFFI